MRKDPSKVNTEGIGINPNLTVEDEYIQNLIKQIHFMDLEIKLMLIKIFSLSVIEFSSLKERKTTTRRSIRRKF